MHPLQGDDKKRHCPMPVWHRAMAKDKGEMVEEADGTGIILSDRAVPEGLTGGYRRD